jgi:hypothetical protein
VRERRHLRLGLAGQRHSKAQKQVLQPIVHWEFPRSVLRQITNSPVSDWQALIVIL